MLTHLEPVEKRHKNSLNVGTIPQLPVTPVLTHITELYCTSEMSKKQRLLNSRFISQSFIRFICGIGSVKTYFLCCAFQFVVVAML